MRDTTPKGQLTAFDPKLLAMLEGHDRATILIDTQWLGLGDHQVRNVVFVRVAVGHRGNAINNFVELDHRIDLNPFMQVIAVDELCADGLTGLPMWVTSFQRTTKISRHAHAALAVDLLVNFACELRGHLSVSLPAPKNLPCEVKTAVELLPLLNPPPSALSG